MELPKNITQIGESNPYCKIFIEDYAYSYLKQMNRFAEEKEIGIAFFGRKIEEQGVSYFFFYGAAKIASLGKEIRHPSQTQLQEIESVKDKYFREYDFLGYHILNGEMIEGMYVAEQSGCRFQEGYAKFYEKNDSMLALMLEEGTLQQPPETVCREKYETVKKRQEERKNHTHAVRYHKTIPAALLLLVCAMGAAAWNVGGQLNDLREEWKEIVAQAGQKKLPEVLPASAAAAEETITMQDKLAEALIEENEKEIKKMEENQEEVPAQIEEEMPGEKQQEEFQKPQQSETLAVEVPQQAPKRYVVQKGDTLLAICLRQYGDNGKMSEICQLNQIENPDDIKSGQRLLLP